MQALMIQCAALVFTLLLFVLASMAGLDIPAIALVMLQGAVAALVSRWRRLAPWWLYIQFLFPIALGLTQRLHLPSEIFLAGFVFLVALYWTTFRTQVPFYPSGRAVWTAVAGLLPPARAIKAIDVGSGLGGLICYLAARRPDSSFTGVEAAPLPWLASRIRTRTSNCCFIRGDYNRLDFTGYDVLFAYLSGAAMPALWEKAHAEMRPGALLLSYEFAIPDAIPHITLRPEPDGPTLYGWYI